MNKSKKTIKKFFKNREIEIKIFDNPYSCFKYWLKNLDGPPAAQFSILTEGTVEFLRYVSGSEETTGIVLFYENRSPVLYVLDSARTEDHRARLLKEAKELGDGAKFEAPDPTGWLGNFLATHGEFVFSVSG